MRLKNSAVQFGALVAVAMLTAACADSVSPTLARPLSLGTPLLSVTSTNDFAGNGVTDGQVKLCKTTPAGSPAYVANFTIGFTSIQGSPNALGNSTPSISVPAGGGTVCAIIYTSGFGAAQLAITEQAPPANWALTSIAILQVLHTGSYPAWMTADTEVAPTATIVINSDMARVVTFTNTYTPPTGNAGCTPGYWKQPQHADSWPGAYSPSDGFNATFGIGTAWFSNSFTLLDGLKAGGGGTNALARHAVAALLNAESGFYPMTTAQVIAEVQAVYPAGSIESTKDLFGGYNEIGCPLN